MHEWWVCLHTFVVGEGNYRHHAGQTTAYQSNHIGPFLADYKAYEADVESDKLSDGGESHDGVEGARHVAIAE